MTDPETHHQDLIALRSDVDNINTKTIQLTRQITETEARIDDADNRSRRNQLIFYNLKDDNPSETYAQSEEIVLRYCCETLKLTIDPKDIERAHRLGCHSPRNLRPIIVKFGFFKTKELILSKGTMQKGTGYIIGEDVSRPVRAARKQLVAFARSKSTAFSLRYKALHIGSKR